MNALSKRRGIPSTVGDDSFKLRPLAPYDLSLAARFFALRTANSDGPKAEPSTTERLSDCKRYEHLTLYAVLAGRPVQITTKDIGTIDAPNLEISWRELRWSTEKDDHYKARKALSSVGTICSVEVKRHLRMVLSLDIDLQAFYETLARNEQLKQLRQSLCGLKPALTGTVFDAALWAIVGQQVTLGFALKLKERLATRYGNRFGCDGKEMFAAPTAESLAETDVATLRALQLSGRKAEYVLTLSQAVMQGTIDLEALRLDSYERSCEKLLALRGIGKWTANYILMRGAGHLDALPLGDAGLRRAVRRAYDLRRPPTDEEITERAEPFRPYRSLFTLYLWQGFA